MSPETRALLEGCLNRGASVDETVAMTGLARVTVWRYRNKSNDGLVPGAKGQERGGWRHYKRKRRNIIEPNVVPWLRTNMHRLTAGR